MSTPRATPPETGFEIPILGSIRAIWALQDKLALDADEEKAIELKRELVNGQERVVWNPTLCASTREFEVSGPEAARIQAALQMWERYAAGADRHWLEPLVEVLFPSDIQKV